MPNSDEEKHAESDANSFEEFGAGKGREENGDDVEVNGAKKAREGVVAW